MSINNDFFEKVRQLVDEREDLRTREDELDLAIYDYICDIRDQHGHLWTLISFNNNYSIEAFFTKQEAENYCKYTNRMTKHIYEEESINIDLEIIARLLGRQDEKNKFLKRTLTILGLQKYRNTLFKHKDTTGIIAKMIWAARFSDPSYYKIISK
jgi:hypothetical protein